jgi:hypothetical protein
MTLVWESARLVEARLLLLTPTEKGNK